MKVLGRILASVFVVWHAAVLVFTPAPSVRITTPIQDLTRFYSRGLHLDSAWRMFVKVSWGGKVDYILYDDHKKVLKQSHIVPDGLWFTSAYIDYYYLQYQVYEDDRSMELVADLSDFFCRKFSQLKPASVSFLIHYQNEVSPEEFKRSMDPAHVEDKLLSPIKCKA